MADSATIANAYVQIMPSMEGATSNITDAIMPGVTAAGDKAGGAFGNVFSGKLGGVLKAAGAAAIAGFTIDAAAQAFTAVESGFNKVKLATGATGEQAKALESVYLDVSRNVVGSFDDIGSAVGELNTRLGIEGEQLEEASEAMMKYAKVTGQDATKATQDVASMMRNVGIPTEELTGTLDKLTKAGQAAGIDVSSLTNNITKYNAVMKEMGFTTDEQIALMAQFEISGADTATILNAMKKGVADWAKEGKDAGEEFRNFVQGVQDGSVTAGDAVEIFGTKGGLSLYEAARKGQLSFEEMFNQITGASSGALDSVYNSTLTAQEKFDLLGKTFQTGFYEIIEPIMDAIAPHMDEIIDGIKGVVEFIVNVVVPTVETIIDIFDKVYNFVSGVIALLGGDFDTFTSNMQTVFDDTGIDITDTFDGVLKGIEEIPGKVVGFFTGIGDRITEAIGSINFPTPHVTWETIRIGNAETPFSLPHVNWYDTGGIFDQPAIIGVGEKRREVVAPLEELPGLMREAGYGHDGEIVALLRAILNKDANVYLDGRELARSTVGYTDRLLGSRAALSARGGTV